MGTFIGRQEELEKLREFQTKKTASFILIKGRRRIGKSRLIQEFSRYFGQFYTFTGLPPDKKTTATHQLDEFSRQLTREFKTATARYADWSDALYAVGERVQKGKVLVVFDEISWMGSKDPTFLGKIKNCWDLQLKNNTQLIFIICGSASAWIEKNILGSTGFVGRISHTLTLKELTLENCKEFWQKNIAAYEKLKVLTVTGGVPKYLEEIQTHWSAEENIKQLCFTNGGFLVNEFDHMFSGIFLRESLFYRHILECLVDGAKEPAEISKLLSENHRGRISEYLWELEEAGFIRRDYTWNITIGTDSKLSRYRLSDNNLRFYLKYIVKNKTKIKRDAFELKSLTALPGWETIMGFSFENLVLNNRKVLWQQLKLSPDEIINENPFFQHKTTRAPGCQIDYMVQTRFNTLYVCEIKFSKHEINTAVIDEVQKKINSLPITRGMSCRPILVHVNGVHADIIDSGYFSAIVDFGRLLD